MERITRAAVFGLFLLCIAQVNGYSKYGRTCKDIGCRSNEICVMAEDPCTLYSRNECGRYPTCKRSGDAGGQSCTTMICPTGQYCKTENGRPTCVNTSQNLGYDSAGISSVNGERTSDNANHDHASTNTNPYANANAPPAEEPNRNYPVSAGTNQGYPPYPSSSNNKNNNNHGNSGSGYPPYPSSGSGSSSSGSNLGYPPYPTQNRMPMPGQTGIYQQQPPPPAAGGYYPGNSAAGYPSYPTNHQYPGHSNYPYQTRNYNANAHYPRTRNSAPKASLAHFTCFGTVGLVFMIAKYLS